MIMIGRLRFGSDKATAAGLLAVGAVLVCACRTCASVPLHDDHAALMDLYKALGGQQWVNATYWGSDTPICNLWFGVKCSDAGRVNYL